jgi:hydrogenase expression/formation protein HypC
MCLAIPMKVLDIQGTSATVEIGGVKRKADISLVSPVKVGDYVVVHAGFAISVSNEEEAKKTLDLFDEIIEAQNKLEEDSQK